MTTFEISIKFNVRAISLNVAKLVAMNILNLVKSAGANDVYVTVTGSDGVEHRMLRQQVAVPASNTTGAQRWAHNVGGEQGTHGNMVKTIYEDDES